MPEQKDFPVLPLIESFPAANQQSAPIQPEKRALKDMKWLERFFANYTPFTPKIAFWIVVSGIILTVILESLRNIPFCAGIVPIIFFGFFLVNLIGRVFLIYSEWGMTDKQWLSQYHKDVDYDK